MTISGYDDRVLTSSSGSDGAMSGPVRPLLKQVLPIYRATLGRLVRSLFHLDLIERTGNFSDVRWLGWPVWQNVLDLWAIQEAIAELRPALLIETGTNQGGSAQFYANLFDLLGHGEVVTIDVEERHSLDHSRVLFLHGNSISPEVLSAVRERVRSSTGPVMVILDSNHSQRHVAAELEAYGPMVTPGSFMLVQDGCIDKLPTSRRLRPGPLPAIRRFLPAHSEFVVERGRDHRFLITHHPMGWLRKVRS